MKKMSQQIPKAWLLKRLWLLPLGVVALGLTKLAQNYPDVTERVYSRSIYPQLVKLVGWLPSLVGFSVAEGLVVIFFIGCLLLASYYLWQLVKGVKKRGLVVYHFLTAALGIFSTVYVAFTLLCGPNYYRHPFSQQAGYQLEGITATELTAVTEGLAKDLADAREAVTEASTAKKDFGAYGKKAVAAMKQLGENYPSLRIAYTPPKPVILSEGLSYANITGIFIPFTMEANINRDVPFFTIPATMCHELSYQAGFMREDEANFLAYLACRDSSDPLVRYSGLLLAFDYAISALQPTNAEKAQEILKALPQKIRIDRSRDRSYWQQHQGAFSEFSSSVNDLYLKANSQSAGVASYNQMVVLLVGEWRQHGDSTATGE